MNKNELWLLKEKYDGRESEAFAADCQRLAAGEPLAYVIGYIPFLDTVIHLDSHPLIPRPETEFWVNAAIADIKRAKPEAPRVLDLCAGSGCIGIAVAKAIPTAHVTFAEINTTHLPTIENNILANGVPAEQCHVIVSDLFENITGQFDYILTNPPYIDPVLDRTEPSVKAFEPAEALYGGHEGMALIETIIESAREYLTLNGTMYLEHEPEQSETIRSLAAGVGLRCQTHTDQYNTPRYNTFTVSQ